MGFWSYKSVESNKVVTFLNGMTATRAVGGVALGVGMATLNLDPAFVAVSAAALAATDGEGFMLNATKRFPGLQKTLRIMPSAIGRKLDPIADKLFAISVFAGGMANGSIPLAHGAGILATEFATSAVTVAANSRGTEVEVSTPGTIGMIARCAAIGFDLSAAASGPGDLHNALAYAGHGSAAAAVVLGAMSCYNIYKQSSGT